MRDQLNYRARKHLNDIKNLLVPGTPYEDVVSAIIEREIDIDDTSMTIDERLQQVMDFHRNPSEPYSRHEKDGRWIMIKEYKTKTGGTFLIRSDISELKRAQDQIQLAMEQAEHANRAKSEFLSSMSHELRTPMNAILGFGQLLENLPGEPLSETQREYIGLILLSGNHLLELINDVLDLAKIESGSVGLEIESVSPREVISELMPIIEEMMKDKNIQFVDECDGPDNNVVYADKTKFKQALLNLFSNAIKFNLENGKIILGCKKGADNLIRICVTDTGKGIPAGKHSQLFEPFNRLGVSSNEIPGTGIGLSITKRLVEMMDGRIDFESAEGKGSTFWIELPMVPE